MVTPFKFSEEERRAAVERVAKGGESYTAVAKDLGVSPQTIRNWQDALGVGSVASRPTRVAPPKGEGTKPEPDDEEAGTVESEPKPKKRAPAKTASPKKASKAPAPAEVDTLDFVEDLGLGLVHSMAVLALLDAEDGAAGVAKLEEARELVEREIARRGAAS